MPGDTYPNRYKIFLLFFAGLCLTVSSDAAELKARTCVLGGFNTVISGWLPATDSLFGIRILRFETPYYKTLGQELTGPEVDSKLATGNRINIINHYWFELVVLGVVVGIILLALISLLILKTKSNKQYRHLSQELQQYKENLEQEVKTRTVELQQRNKELESFSYTMAHDLRTPLRGMISFSQILQEDAADNLTDEEKSYLARIITAGKHMEKLIDNIHELARISRAPMAPITVNLSDIASHIKYKLTSSEPQRKSEWIIQPDLECEADLKLMDNLLSHLLENAWKYTARQEQAIIEFGCTPDSSEVIYYVKDNGIGFDLKYSKNLFKPFQRLHSIEDFEGTGIGLAIVHRVIEQHGGRVWIESAPDKGTTVFFTLKNITS